MSQCDGCQPGFCPRHGINKTPKLVELCGDQSRPGYFEAWEKGYGPGQSAKGLGDRVAKAINTVTGGRVKPCGGCGQRRKRLNELSRDQGQRDK